MSFLVARKQFDRVAIRLENDRTRAAERYVLLSGILLLLTGLMTLLLLTPIQMGLLPVVFAVAAMFGYSVYAVLVGCLYHDNVLLRIGLAMTLLCFVSLIERSTFGFVENVLLVMLVVGFLRFYEQRWNWPRKNTVSRNGRSPNDRRSKSSRLKGRRATATRDILQVLVNRCALQSHVV